MFYFRKAVDQGQYLLTTIIECKIDNTSITYNQTKSTQIKTTSQIQLQQSAIEPETRNRIVHLHDLSICHLNVSH